MTKQHQWKGSLSAIRTHIDPERDQHLKWMKLGKQPESPLAFLGRIWDTTDPARSPNRNFNFYSTLTKTISLPAQYSPHGGAAGFLWFTEWQLIHKIENQIDRIVKLTKTINSGNRDRRQKKKSEMLAVTEDFQKQYEALYLLHQDLRDEIKKNFATGDGNGPSSSSSSGSDGEAFKPKFEASNEIKTSDVEETKHEESEAAIKVTEEDSGTSLDRTKYLEGLVAELKVKLEAKTEKLLKLEHQTTKIQAISKENESKLHELLKQFEEKEQQYKSKISDLLAEVNDTQIELSAWKQYKSELEGRLEHESKQHVLQVTSLMEQFNTMDNHRAELELEIQKKSDDRSNCLIQIERLKNDIKIAKEENESLISEMNSLRNEKSELENAITKLKEENKKGKTRLSKCRSNIQLLERKQEEMVEEFRKQIEDEYVILNRRLNVVEQLQFEYKDWHRKAKEAFEKGGTDMKALTSAVHEFIASLDSLTMKFEQSSDDFLNRISKTSCELKFAKDWAMRKNIAVGDVKDDVEKLLEQVSDKEGEMLVMREKLWKSEHKVRELMKADKAKEDAMLVLVEEKREAIRQLCVWIDYHRARSDYYKKVILNTMSPGLKKAR